jgi:hypothetical protein
MLRERDRGPVREPQGATKREKGVKEREREKKDLFLGAEGNVDRKQAGWWH